MSFSSLDRREREELLAHGVPEGAFTFLEAVLAKKQVVLLEEVVARSKQEGVNLSSVVRGEQARLTRSVKGLVLRRREVMLGKRRVSYIVAVWRRKGTREVVREVL